VKLARNPLLDSLIAQSRDLSLVALGAYAALVIEYAERGSLDPERIAALGQSREEREALMFALGEFFLRDPEDPEHRHRHPALDAALVGEARQREGRAQGGRARWEKYHQLPLRSERPAAAGALPAAALPAAAGTPPAAALAPAAAGKIRSLRQAGTRIPDDFQVTESMRQWARKEGLPAPDLHVEHFVDYWTASASAGAVKRDWNAAFRNWLRKEAQFIGGKNDAYETNQPRRLQPTVQHARRRQNNQSRGIAFPGAEPDALEWLDDNHGAGHAPRLTPGRVPALEGKTGGNS
jgi:uncharacterized protein YdaU (DUF1376 family)